jgi:hypothetical protein
MIQRQFKFEVQHLLKTGSKGKYRNQDLMAVNPSAKRSQRELHSKVHTVL